MRWRVTVIKSRLTGDWTWRCPECSTGARGNVHSWGHFHTWDYAYASAHYHANSYHRERK